LNETEPKARSADMRANANKRYNTRTTSQQKETHKIQSWIEGERIRERDRNVIIIITYEWKRHPSS
jgi:hypothetical protein